MSNPNRLSYHPDPSSGSLKDINDDLDKIFNTYTSNYSNNSNDTLDSETAPPPISSTSKHHRLIPPTVLDRFSATNDYSVHISSRLSSLKQGSADVIHSAPQSPNSGSSFDFYSQDHRAMSNGSLDILNTPIIEQELKDIISPEKYGEVAKSNEALKSLNLEDDEIPSSIAVSGTKSEDWHERGAATRTVGDESNGFTVIRRNVTDFEFGKPLGEGSYSTVVLATDKITSTKYAVKILDKRHIIKEKKVKYVNIEKHALNRLSNRMGVVSLYFTFQDKDSLYFVLDYASNGELLSLIKKYNTLNEDCVRYFGAQILDAIKYMHDNGVIHRDIKPENILLDDKLRIQITDFGTARLLEKVSEESEEYPVDVRAKSFVGTAEYVSPELLDNKYCGKPGDIWAFGCILYQMIAGKPPFKAANEYLTFQKITKLQYAFSAGFPLVMRDLIKQVLVLQPSRRADIPTIQKHYFFQGINFDDFNQIWYSEVPELGPFKMSAKSMMKIPELSKSASSQSVATKRVPRKKDKRTVSEPSHNGNNNAKVSTASSAGAPLNPAAAAAFVLNKKEDSSDTEDSADTATDDIPNNTQTSSRTSSRAPSSAPSSAPLPDYIPGTNILRPTINSIHSYSRSSSRTKPQRKPKFKSKILEVSPITPLEVAWGKYLKSSDERILKIGPVIAHKTTTEQFERKYRGLIHESPLGFKNRGKGNSSFLSQVVSGNSTGLRDNQTLPVEEIEDDQDESKAIRDYFMIEEIPSSASSENAPTNTKISSKLFKRLGISNSKDKNSASEPVSQHPLEKGRTCTMLVTSFGRVLIFFRNDPEVNYRLISEVRLSYPFIQFKEVVTNSGRLSKILPTTGMFAIQSNVSTLTFEVEKYDVNHWTEALAKAQTNQFERMKLEKEKLVEPNLRSKPKSNSGSPRLMDAPQFTNLRVQQSPKQQKEETTRKVSDPKPSSSHGSHSRESLLSNRIQHRSSVKRKPPPPVKAIAGGLDMSTGLGSSNESGMLHAAQLAVSNSSNNPVTYNRRSSFTKDDRNAYTSAASSSKARASPSPHPHAITSMNSKFLARSQRKK